MSDTTTTHYSLVQPQVGGSFNTWGNKINNDLSTLDSIIYAVSGGINQGLNAPTGSASSISLTNPLVTIQNIAFTASGQQLNMPAMNATSSVQTGTPIKIVNMGSYSFPVYAQDAATIIYGNGVAAGTITSGGSGYTNGYYPNTSLTGGSGTGATADITVSGNIVTICSPVHPGSGYAIGNTLSASLPGGSGFAFQVSAFSGLAPGATLILTPTSNATANGSFNAVIQGDLYSGNNLSDLTNPSYARTNLGLGASAVLNLGNMIVNDGAGNLTISASAVLPNGVTATTQSASNNSTLLATTAFVNSYVSGNPLTLYNGTTATTQALNDSSTKLATTAFVNPGSSQGSNGYMKLPNGLIVQWGVATCGSGWTSIALPITFPNNLFQVTTALQATTAGFQAACGYDAQTSTTSHISLACINSNSGAYISGLVSWMAIGN